MSLFFSILISSDLGFYFVTLSERGCDHKNIEYPKFCSTFTHFILQKEMIIIDDNKKFVQNKELREWALFNGVIMQCQQIFDVETNR
jgi:hypothetical protein